MRVADDGAQALFREELRTLQGASTLRGFLKMYKTVDMRKMAAFLEGEFAAPPGGTVRPVPSSPVCLC